MGIRALAIASILLGAATFGWGAPAFSSYLAANRPNVPDPASGRTLEKKYRGGGVVYISWNDAGLEATICVVGIVLLMAGMKGLDRGFPSSPKA